MWLLGSGIYGYVRKMIDFKEIPKDGEKWELFARDFLESFGFYVEIPPDRGSDGGRDIIVVEKIKGKLHSSKLRWLVSCKHFAHSNKAVNENDHEKNLLERIKAFKADGFIGFYSTIASSGLNQRLSQLRENLQIKDYKIFDGKTIENYLVTVGYSHLLLRYFPESYKNVKPLHALIQKYEPLRCNYCGKDLLISLFDKKFNGAVMVQVFKNQNGKEVIYDVYCACKGKCDTILEKKYILQGLQTGWNDISDIIIPVEYLRLIFAVMNRIRNGIDIYTDEAYKKQKSIFIKIAQKVLRYTTEKEKERFALLQSLPF